MSDGWLVDLGELALSAAVLAGLVAVAVYVVRKVRRETGGRESSTGEMMSKFRELHSRGVLSDEEFRTIRTSLSTRLQDELKDTGEKACDD